MNLINAIRKEIECKGLNSSEASEMEKTIRSYNGLNLTNKYSIKRKALRAISYDTKNPTEMVGAEGAISNNEYLNKCRYYEDIANGVIVPYITADNVKWGYTNPYDRNINCSKLALKPNRISTYADISSMLDIYNEKFGETIENVLEGALFDKVVQVMFSTQASTDEQPKGLFNGVTAKTISEDNLINAMLDVEKYKHNGMWVISPSAFAYILKNHKDLFNDGKFVGFDYVVDGRVEDKYAAFIDLSQIAIGDWLVNSYNIDNVTKKVEGFIRVNIESYFDFGLLDNKAISVLKTA